MIVANGSDLRYYLVGSMPVLVVPCEKLGQLHVSVNELLGMCYSNIEYLAIHIIGLSG